jgi:hypothetical protein
MRFFLMKEPMRRNSFLNSSCHGRVFTGWVAKGIRSEVILKKRRSETAFNERISDRHSRLAATVDLKRTAEYDARRNVFELRQGRENLMHG